MTFKDTPLPNYHLNAGRGSQLLNMTFCSSFAMLYALTLFHLFSQTNAIPEVCQLSNLETAVGCGCFLYQPFYKGNPRWSGVETGCLQELSGNLQAGESRCKSAPFSISPSSSTSTRTALITAADEYFHQVKQSCEKLKEAQEARGDVKGQSGQAGMEQRAPRPTYDRGYPPTRSGYGSDSGRSRDGYAGRGEDSRRGFERPRTRDYSDRRPVSRGALSYSAGKKMYVFCITISFYYHRERRRLTVTC